MEHCANQDKEVPDGMSKGNDAITLEEDNTSNKRQSSQKQLIYSCRFSLKGNMKKYPVKNNFIIFRINLRIVLQIALCTLLHDKNVLNLHTIIKATAAGHTPIIR